MELTSNVKTLSTSAMWQLMMQAMTGLLLVTMDNVGLEMGMYTNTMEKRTTVQHMEKAVMASPVSTALCLYQWNQKLSQREHWVLEFAVNHIEVLNVVLLTVHASLTDASVSDTGSEMETIVLNKSHCHWLHAAPPQTPHVLMVTVNVELTDVSAKLELSR